jgi:S-methylmethionine-dependent homocysteine/selenocysteine methylase
VVISGCVGPQDDAYSPSSKMSADAAREYHSAQINTFADTAADMVNAVTLTYADEAIGIARAAGNAGIPVAISFTVETDGRLPDGQTLGEAIQRVDEQTNGARAYYGVNGAHPTHFDEVLAADELWRRIHAVRAANTLDAKSKSRRTAKVSFSRTGLPAQRAGRPDRADEGTI